MTNTEQHPQVWIPAPLNLQPRSKGKLTGGVDVGGASTTPIRSVEAGPLWFECWLEEGKAKEELARNEAKAKEELAKQEAKAKEELAKNKAKAREELAKHEAKANEAKEGNVDEEQEGTVNEVEEGTSNEAQEIAVDDSLMEKA